MYVRGARDGEREGVDCKVGAGEWGNDEGNDGSALARAAPYPVEVTSVIRFLV